MNRKRFYDGVRSSLFGGRLTPEQVGGMEALLDAADEYPVTDVRQLAYILAGVFHEVGKRMVPVREGFASTDAGARAAVQRLHEAGRISRNYAAPVNGVSYYGRGRIQNTHHANYEKLEKRFGQPFVTNPDLLLDSEIDAAVTIAGHMEGIWTGKKLADFIDGSKADYVNARRIVNGTDKASMIAGYAQKFESALRAAGFGSTERDEPILTVPTPTPRPEPEPATMPNLTPVEQANKAVGAGTYAALASAIWTAIVAANVLPDAFTTPEFQAAMGGVIASVAAVVGAYRAADKRFQA